MENCVEGLQLPYIYFLEQFLGIIFLKKGRDRFIETSAYMPINLLRISRCVIICITCKMSVFTYIVKRPIHITNQYCSQQLS